MLRHVPHLCKQAETHGTHTKGLKAKQVSLSYAVATRGCWSKGTPNCGSDVTPHCAALVTRKNALTLICAC